MNSILEFLDKKDQSNKYKVENKLPKKTYFKTSPQRIDGLPETCTFKFSSLCLGEGRRFSEVWPP